MLARKILILLLAVVSLLEFSSLVYVALDVADSHGDSYPAAATAMMLKLTIKY